MEASTEPKGWNGLRRLKAYETDVCPSRFGVITHKAEGKLSAIHNGGGKWKRRYTIGATSVEEHIA